MLTPSINEKIEDLKPRLKTGTRMLSRPSGTFVGRLDAGIEISHPATREILAAMNGTRSCQEISGEIGVPLEILSTLMRELDGAHLLDIEPCQIKVHARFHSPNPQRSTHLADDSKDGAYRQLHQKISPELAFTTWLENVKDGGISLLGARRNWEVTIYGDSRIALLLYGILLSSGVSHSSLIAMRESSTVNDQDLCAGYLRASDIGLSLTTRVDELGRESSLFPVVSPPLDGAEGTQKKIKVVVGLPPADFMQQWMSEGIPHLFVENPDCASINLGPLVIPGQTPCWRCVSLARADQNILWREIERQLIATEGDEVPVAVAHHVAGLTALELLRFIDTGQSQFIGTTIRLNYHSPTSAEPRLFSRHPACGCNW